MAIWAARRWALVAMAFVVIGMTGCERDEMLTAHWGPCRPTTGEPLREPLRAEAAPAPPAACWTVRHAMRGYFEIFNRCTGERRIRRTDDDDNPTMIEVENIVTGEGWNERYRLVKDWDWTSERIQALAAGWVDKYTWVKPEPTPMPSKGQRQPTN